MPGRNAPLLAADGRNGHSLHAAGGSSPILKHNTFSGIAGGPNSVTSVYVDMGCSVNMVDSIIANHMTGITVQESRPSYAGFDLGADEWNPAAPEAPAPRAPRHGGRRFLPGLDALPRGGRLLLHLPLR